jgi:hypothetical protein
MVHVYPFPAIDFRRDHGFSSAGAASCWSGLRFLRRYNYATRSFAARISSKTFISCRAFPAGRKDHRDTPETLHRETWFEPVFEIVGHCGS